MRFTAQKTAFCMAAAAHMPIKNDEEDEEEFEDESEGEDAANGDDSASVAVAATAAAAARTTTDSALSPTLAVHPDRKRSVEIGLDDKDRPVTVTVGSGAVMTWIRVPKSSSLEGTRKNLQRSNFFPNLLNAVADKDNEENAAFWLFMAAGRKYPKGFEHAAKMLGYIPSAPKKMDPIAVAAMWEDANVNRTQRRKILRHLKAYFGLRLTAREHDVTALGQGYYKPITEKRFWRRNYRKSHSLRRKTKT
jgi:hypothetical protein